MLLRQHLQGWYLPDTVITNRLWRVDAHEGDVLVAASIDGGQAEQIKFYVPLEDIWPGRLEPPSSAIVGPSSISMSSLFDALRRFILEASRLHRMEQCYAFPSRFAGDRQLIAWPCDNPAGQYVAFWPVSS